MISSSFFYASVVVAISLLVVDGRKRQSFDSNTAPSNEDVKKPSFGTKWHFAGPFIIGKTEIDSDPLAALAHFHSESGEPCILQRVLRKEKGNSSRLFWLISSIETCVDESSLLLPYRMSDQILFGNRHWGICWLESASTHSIWWRIKTHRYDTAATTKFSCWL